MRKMIGYWTVAGWVWVEWMVERWSGVSEVEKRTGREEK